MPVSITACTGLEYACCDKPCLKKRKLDTLKLPPVFTHLATRAHAALQTWQEPRFRSGVHNDAFRQSFWQSLPKGQKAKIKRSRPCAAAAQGLGLCKAGNTRARAATASQVSLLKQILPSLIQCSSARQYEHEPPTLCNNVGTTKLTADLRGKEGRDTGGHLHPAFDH